MTVSVRSSNAELVTAQVKVEGSTIPDTFLVTEIEVCREANRVPFAVVVLADGERSRETFEASASDILVPGNKIELLLGYHAKDKPVFKGIIVSQKLRLDGSGNSYLELGCEDEAIKLTVARTNQYFLAMSDSEAMLRVISSAGLSARVSDTTGSNEHLLQAYATDWDFLVARAEVNGLIVLADGGKVTVLAPGKGEPRYDVQFGESLSEMNLTLDATNQLGSVKASAWDSKTQAVIEANGAEPSLSGNLGNLDGKKLSQVLSVKDFDLSTQAGLEQEDLTNWASAQMMKSRLSRIQGTVKFPGNAGVNAGDMLELKGLGPRFNGSAYVTGVRHTLSSGYWQTEAAFGLNRRWFTDLNRDVSAPAAAGLVPAAGGLHVGKVLQVYDDPQEANRVKVSLPLFGAGDGIWVRLIMPYASEGIGVQFMPEIGDEVLLGFLSDDPNAAVIMGSVYSAARPAPIKPDENNSLKTITTRSKLEIGFDDEKKIMTFKTPGGHVVTLSDEEKTVSVVDSNNNTLKMSEDGIEMTSPKDVTISAEGSLTLKGSSGVTVSSPSDVTVDGSDISASGSSSVSIDGGMSTSISGGTDVTITGAMVNIN